MKKFTLIELLIVVSIIGILVSILIPSLGKARESAKRAVCKSNQSQIMKGMFMSANTNNHKVPIGTINNFRYAMPIWDANRVGKTGDGWMAFGHIYRDTEMSSIGVWDCPSRKENSYWQRPRKDRWPPGESSGKFSHSAFAVRSGSDWVWSGYKEPKNMPFISELETDLTYMSDQFAGTEIYNDRHGSEKIIQLTKMNGAVLQSKGGAFHSLASGNGAYTSVTNSTMTKMWEILDDVKGN